MSQFLSPSDLVSASRRRNLGKLVIVVRLTAPPI
jgi:hypothetical protein